MIDSDRDRLRSIKTFPSLVAYLRDELDWPIDADDFDDLTFEYAPEELGIDAKTAAKIEGIKQLRPLVTHQPWGIFFVKFEPMRLPVVALRRILSQLVIKKRASARQSELASWDLHDLLFISNYGEGDQRQITFAHFAQDEQTGDLPTLRVLGWDDADTALHLDHVHRELEEKLHWPEDEKDRDGWREKWASAFTLRHREVITTSKDLAVHMADLAKRIRRRANHIIAIETDRGPLRKLHKAFKEALIHDLAEDDFADMYAQTITYGLLAARVSRRMGIVADNVVDMVPITNPFLKEMLSAFLTVGGRKGKMDFDELGIQEVVELLNSPDTHMDAVLRDFGNRTRQEDPVINFYELFLKEYDKEKKVQRGVFYTPQPVVSYIVRSVHELLQTEFGLEDGLASTVTWGEMANKNPTVKIPKGLSSAEPFVQILDPATGTATFLVEVIEVIHKTMTAKWQKQSLSANQLIAEWNNYVAKHLLPRLHGYELMMAPYAIANMKIGLKLAETGFQWPVGFHGRARIYLTNALEPPSPLTEETAANLFEALGHEAQAVNAVKRQKRFTVVIGNPPYSPSICEPEWLMRILDDWKQGLNETKSDLNREEWKFLRLAQYHCTTAGAGIVGLIINRDFLDGIVKRRMREHLGQSFPLRIAVDLNGDVKGNIADENVFEIEQGVSIVVLSTRAATPVLRFASRVGTRAQKYTDLLAKKPIDEALITVEPAAPYFRWMPFSSADAADAGAAYAQWMPLDSVFALKSSGIQTKNDAICIGWSADEVFDRVERLSRLSEKNAHAEFGLEGSGVWSLHAAQADLRGFGVTRKNVRRILYRPLDFRFIYYTRKSSGFLGRPRYDLMRHMLDGRNISLIFNRQVVGDGVSHFSVSRDLICHGTFYLGNKGQDYLAPLYQHNDPDLFSSHAGGRMHNFTSAFMTALQAKLGNTTTRLTPEDIFYYVYAVFHSPSYRSRYVEFLKIDFPRLPLTSSLDLFRGLAKLGGELVTLHLMESPKLNTPITRWHGTMPSGEVEKVTYSDETVWIDKAKTCGFKGVQEGVWNFHIGGYQVCEKWLKDRKGRVLSAEDIAHYQKIVVALNETIRIMKEIDEVIDKYGGWPGAFH